MGTVDSNLYDVLKRAYDNKDVEWNSNRIYRIRKSLEETRRLIPRWYLKNNMPNDMGDIIRDYFNRAFDNQNELGVNFGYSYFNDQVEKFNQNPYSIWEVYDAFKDKVNFYEEPFVRYTPNEQQNKEMFLKEALNIMFTETDLSRILVDEFDVKIRKGFADVIVGYYNRKGKSVFENDCRMRLVQKIKEAVKKLDELGALDKNIDAHNDKMKRLGVESLGVSKDMPAIENDKLFGFELEKCSILQLEAMLSFYYNRLEKVREEVGFSLFILAEIEGEDGTDEETLKSLDDDDLKVLWKKYYILSKVSDEVFDIIHKMEIDAEWKIDGEELEKAYETLFSKYKQGYLKLIYDIDYEDEILVYRGAKESSKNVGFREKHNTEDEQAVSNEESTDMHSYDAFMSDVALFSLVNAGFKINNYLIKSRLMEDIIIQADRQKINWGVMEEEGEIKIKKNVLIGVDVPGLNMPLRLHYEVDAIKDLMTNYLKTENVPLYIGSDDFDTRGKTEGTQLLLPLSTKQSNYIKSLAKKKDLPMLTSKFVKHISCVQMPNMVKRLLKEKISGTQTMPNSINIFTKKVNREGLVSGTEEIEN